MLQRCNAGIWLLLLFCLYQPTWLVTADLYAAARDGDLEQLETALREQPELIGTPNEGGSTALNLAVEHDQFDCARVLLEHGAPPDLQADALGRTPLHAAINANSARITALLLDHKADPNKADFYRYSAFRRYLTNPVLLAQAPALLGKFLDAGADADQVFLALTDEEWRPLLPVLLDHGASPTAVIQAGWPAHPVALMEYALLNSDQNMLKLLLDHGADPNVANAAGDSPFRYVLNLAVAEVLVNHGGDPNRLDATGAGALHVGLGTFNAAVTKLYLTQGADPSRPDSNGHTPFWYARKPEVAVCLLDHGAQVTPAERQVLYENAGWHARLLYEREPTAASLLWPAIWGLLVGATALTLYRRARARRLARIQTPVLDAAKVPGAAALSSWSAAPASERSRTAQAMGWPQRLQFNFEDTRWLTLVPFTGWSLLWAVFFIDPFLRSFGPIPNLAMLGFTLGLAAVVAQVYAGSTRFGRAGCIGGLVVTLGALGYDAWLAIQFLGLGIPVMVALWCCNGLVLCLNFATLGRIWNLHRTRLGLQKAQQGKEPQETPADELEAPADWDEVVKK